MGMKTPRTSSYSCQLIRATPAAVTTFIGEKLGSAYSTLVNAEFTLWNSWGHHTKCYLLSYNANVASSRSNPQSLIDLIDVSACICFAHYIDCLSVFVLKVDIRQISFLVLIVVNTDQSCIFDLGVQSLWSPSHTSKSISLHLFLFSCESQACVQPHEVF